MSETSGIQGTRSDSTIPGDGEVGEISWIRACGVVTESSPHEEPMGAFARFVSNARLVSNAFTTVFKGLDPIPQYKARAKLAGFLQSVRPS